MLIFNLISEYVMINKSDILDAYKFRFSTKKFDTNKKVSEADMSFIMETARLSPTSFGFEPFKFLVISNEDAKMKFHPYTWGGQGQIPTCTYLVIALAKTSHFMKYDSEYITNFMEKIQKLPENVVSIKRNIFKDFQIDQYKLLESERAMIDWSAKQTYIALGNMLTSAAMIGIDSCPIEGFLADKIQEVLEQEFNISKKEYYPAVMAAFGYRAEEPTREKTRQDISEIVEWVK
jgi:nitroreductase